MREVWGADPAARDVWPSDAQRSLLEAALREDRRAVAAWERIQPLIDVERMDGSTLAMLPSLRRNLTRLGVEHPLMGLFRGVHRHTWATNQLLIARMAPVVGALERAGVSTLLLKGAALLARGTSDAGMRAMGDIDVLVAPGQLERAVAVLGEEGLFPVQGAPVWYVLELVPRFSPSYGFRDAGDRQLDLHWHALHGSCQPDADEELWAAASPAELGGVQTRTLCPADELLLVMVHGQRWNDAPVYRWVIDAALIAAGRGGEVDYDRLVRQARRRRLTAPAARGLAYLREAAGLEIPAGVLRSLRVGRLDRAEADALALAPRHRSARQRRLLLDSLALRRELALGRRAGPRALARARRQRESWPLLNLSWSTIGDPGAAPAPRAPPVELALGDISALRPHALRGVWPPDAPGAWLAGDAAVVVALTEAPAQGLVLDIGGVAFGEHASRLVLETGSIPPMELDFAADRVHHVALGLAGNDRGRVELSMRCPGASSPAAAGISDDDRELGVFLHTLRLRATPGVEEGMDVRFGQGGNEQALLAGGWGPSEPDGRWTIGRRARLILAPGSDVRELEIDALANVVAARRMRVTLRANGRHVADLDYGGEDWRQPVRRIALHAPAGRQLELELEVDEPVSPRTLGLGPDERPLGLRLRRLALHGGSASPPSPDPVAAAETA